MLAGVCGFCLAYAIAKICYGMSTQKLAPARVTPLSQFTFMRPCEVEKVRFATSGKFGCQVADTRSLVWV